MHVPASAIDAYKKTAPWSGFGAIVALPVLRGDANDDGEVNMSDVDYIVNYILGNSDETFNAETADVNEDGKVSMPDAMFIVNYILNGKFPDE